MSENDELRELIGQAHGAVKDLRQAVRDAKESRASLVAEVGAFTAAARGTVAKIDQRFAVGVEEAIVAVRLAAAAIMEEKIESMEKTFQDAAGHVMDLMAAEDGATLGTVIADRILRTTRTEIEAKFSEWARSSASALDRSAEKYVRKALNRRR